MNTFPLQREAWLKLPLLVLMAGGGLAFGLYLANPQVRDARSDAGVESRHRIPLAAADLVERMESPEVVVDAAGNLYLTWASRTGPDERTLFFTRSQDGGRTLLPERVLARSGIVRTTTQMKGKDVTRESKLAPHLAWGSNALHLAWTESLPENAGVRMVVASSTDGGQTFGPKTQTHMGDAARPTYTALAAGPQGMLLCSWLDNRNKAQQTFAAFRGPNAVDFEPEQLVHAGEQRGVCPCCPTATALGPDGTCYVAFRNVANGYRDIHIGRKAKDARHFELLSILPPTWKFDGCPHDGPSLVLVGDRMHIAWMDARDGSPRCYHGVAKLGEMRFTTSELHAVAAGSQGNARLCADADGNVHAVWEESEQSAETSHHDGDDKLKPAIGGGRRILYAVRPAESPSFLHVRAVSPRLDAVQTRPSIAVSREKVFVAFHQLDESGKHVVVCTMAREALP